MLIEVNYLEQIDVSVIDTILNCCFNSYYYNLDVAQREIIDRIITYKPGTILICRNSRTARIIIDTLNDYKINEWCKIVDFDKYGRNRIYTTEHT